MAECKKHSGLTKAIEGLEKRADSAAKEREAMDKDIVKLKVASGKQGVIIGLIVALANIGVTIGLRFLQGG